MEASYFEYRTSVHTCDAPTETGWIDACNMDGCLKYIDREYSNVTFGWGDEYHVDTSLPFHAKIEFETDPRKGSLSSVTTTITQRNETIVLPLGTRFCNNNTMEHNYLNGIE